MDRDLIQRQDFPTGRRGYDIAAVDDHLRRVADAFETNTAPPAPPSLAATTSEQVREILEAAERSVTEVRTRAGAEAADHVAQVQAATDGMLAKLDHLESELTRLLSALRTSGEALNQGLSALQADVARGSPDLAGPNASPPDPGRRPAGRAALADGRSPPATAPRVADPLAARRPPRDSPTARLAAHARDDSPPAPDRDSSSAAADAAARRAAADDSRSRRRDSPPARRHARRRCSTPTTRARRPAATRRAPA